MLTWGRINKQFLEAQFCFDVNELLSNSPHSWYVTCGYRTMEESNRLYDEFINGIITGRTADGAIVRGKKGPRAAPAGKSAHNYGLAIDVSLDGDEDKPGLQPTWNTSVAGWTWLKVNVMKHPRLQSLWNYGDWPHIQRLNWRNYVGWKKNVDDNNRALRYAGQYVGLGIPAA